MPVVDETGKIPPGLGQARCRARSIAAEGIEARAIGGAAVRPRGTQKNGVGKLDGCFFD